MKRIPKPRPSGSYTSALATGGVEKPVEICRELVKLIAERTEENVAEFVALRRQLTAVMAGRGPKRMAENARRRLQNPMLRTTYVAERQRALLAQRLRLNEELATHLPAAVAAAIGLEIVAIELAAVDARIDELKAKRPAKAATGLYPAAAAAVDHLFKHHGIEHWHWAAADDDDLKEVAEILSGWRSR